MRRLRSALGWKARWASALCVIAAAGGAATLGAGGACAAELSALPERLSQTGWVAPGGAIAAGNLPYAPQYALWSDGADKSRWVKLPAGETIDTGDPDAWRFPVGTRFWKEFAWDGRRVETRLMWLRAEDDWVFASYVWNEEQTEAHLAPEAGVMRAHDLGDGRWHDVPGRQDCLVCHEGGERVVLGFDALQLSDDRDPLAPHAEPLPPGAATLASLEAAGRFAPARPEWVRQPPRVPENDPVARAARGYLAANCGNCHAAEGSLGRLELDLVEFGPADALAKHGRWIVPNVAPERSRWIAAGDPDASSIAARMASRRPSSQMPPLGSVLVDEEGLALVRKWIAGLGEKPGMADAAMFAARKETR